MSQIESIYSPQVEEQLKRIYSDLEKHQKKVLELSKMSVDFYGGKTASKPADLSQTELQLKRLQLQQERLRQSEERLIISSERLNKVKDKEAQKLIASESLYGKVQGKLNALSNEYKNLAVRKELGLSLTAKEEQRYTSLQGRIQNYDKALKAVDATMGKHQRNVGNYTSGFNPLSNSINQLTREMPAFTYSVQTGFMALSNNIPIFTDAIGNAVRQNKELIAQGQPTTSVLKQLAGAFFSWQTLMGIGITLLTVYGKEIGNFISTAFKGKTALDALKEATRQINEARVEGIKTAQNEIVELKVLLGVAEDETKSKKQRLLAVKELQEKYPEYLGNLTKEKILAGETAEAENRLTNALLSRAKAQAATTKIIENQGKIIDLEERRLVVQKEIEKQEVINERVQKNTADRLRTSTRDEDYALSRSRTESDKLANSKRQLQNINEEINTLNDTNNRLTDYAIENTVLFDEKTKTSKEKTKREIENIIASEYELRKAILERRKAELNNISSNTDLFIDVRIEALEKEAKTEIDLINLVYEHNLEVEKATKEDKIRTYKEALRDRVISQERYNANIKQIELQSAYDVEQINVELGQKLQEQGLKNLNAIKALEKEKADFVIKNSEQINAKQQKVSKEIADDEKKNLKTRQLAFIEYINLAKKELDLAKIREIANAKSGEEIEFILEKYRNLNTELDKILNKESPFAKNQKWLEDFRKGFQDDFISNSGFDKIFFIIENFDKLKDSGVDTALAISEAFQQTFNTIAEASQGNFDREYERLALQKEISLKFAGESATAREEIERQAEEKRKEIARREAESQKKLAIFNIAINTAQAIVATLAKTPPPAGLPLAFAMGALGLAQATLVASQQIPQFWKGTENAPEGLARVGDRHGRELVQDGKTKQWRLVEQDSIQYLTKGSKVKTNRETESILSNLTNFDKDYGNLLFKNQILPPVINNSNNFDFSGVESKISDLTNEIRNKKTATINVYKDKVVTRSGSAELTNARLTIKGRSV